MGNFLELMDIRKDYSHELCVFLTTKITYRSHEPQNQLIQCILDDVKNKIQNGIEKSRYFFIMMNDTSDISNVEQSAISLQLLNEGKIEDIC